MARVGLFRGIGWNAVFAVARFGLHKQPKHMTLSYRGCGPVNSSARVRAACTGTSVLPESL